MFSKSQRGSKVNLLQNKTKSVSLKTSLVADFMKIVTVVSGQIENIRYITEKKNK